MKTAAGIIRMQNKILENMKPQTYIKVDDLKVKCLVSKRNKTFDRAWRELVASGKVEICGNEIRINQ